MTPEQKAEILAARAILFERLRMTLQELDEYVVALEEVARQAKAYLDNTTPVRGLHLQTALQHAERMRS
jgi:uncharacterized tellurite resistance protein B-like protein